MFHYLLGLTTLGSVRPYVRKHIYETLEPTDYFFLNSFFITLFIVIYFAYTYMFDSNSIKKTYENCCKLSHTQIAGLLLLSFFTVISSLMFFHIEKYYNTPFINNMLLKSLSTIALFLVGYFIYEEVYHGGHMLGIGLVVAGLAVLLFNPIKST